MHLDLIHTWHFSLSVLNSYKKGARESLLRRKIKSKQVFKCSPVIFLQNLKGGFLAGNTRPTNSLKNKYMCLPELSITARVTSLCSVQVACPFSPILTDMGYLTVRTCTHTHACARACGCEITCLSFPNVSQTSLKYSICSSCKLLLYIPNIKQWKEIRVPRSCQWILMLTHS